MNIIKAILNAIVEVDLCVYTLLSNLQIELRLQYKQKKAAKVALSKLSKRYKANVEIRQFQTTIWTNIYCCFCKQQPVFTDVIRLTCQI